MLFIKLILLVKAQHITTTTVLGSFWIHLVSERLNMYNLNSHQNQGVESDLFQKYVFDF